MAAEPTDAPGARCLPEDRDREVVADSEGVWHQSGISFDAHFTPVALATERKMKGHDARLKLGESVKPLSHRRVPLLER
jgi:hypothetical protein